MKIAFFSFSLTLILIGCTTPEPIVIGLVADFSGRNNQLALQARNALVMAADELNSGGGVDGRKVEYLYSDNKGNPEDCAAAVREMVEEGATVIFGPIISGLAPSAINAAAESGTLVISSTVSTDDLTGIDDNFIRGTAPASSQGRYLAEIISRENLSNVAVVMDSRNESYTKGVLKGLTTFGGINRKENEIFFQGKEDFPHVVARLEALDPDGVVLLASGIDSAGILQLYSRDRELPMLLGGSWPKVSDILEYSGQIIEGMLFVDIPVNSIPREVERAFHDKYTGLYNIEPNISAVYIYEATRLYSDAVRKARSLDSEKVKNAILSNKIIEGLSENYTIDRYGDGVRALASFVVENGQYRQLDRE